MRFGVVGAILLRSGRPGEPAAAARLHAEVEGEEVNKRDAGMESGPPPLPTAIESFVVVGSTGDVLGASCVAVAVVVSWGSGGTRGGDREEIR